MRSRFLVPITFLLAIAVAPRAGADVAVRGGPRAGIERHDDLDLFVGVEARLSFTLSPLTINPSFDYFFDEQRTLFQISVNSLYYLPTSVRLIDPYAGVGIGLSTFSYRDDAVVADGHGSRVGLNLIGGVCFDVPILAPFVQAMVSVGEVDLVTIGGGFLFGSSRRKGDWDACGRRRGGVVEGGSSQ